MREHDDADMPPIILPNTIWWPLKLHASREQPTPFHLMLLYHWQFHRAEKPEPTLNGYLS